MEENEDKIENYKILLEIVKKEFDYQEERKKIADTKVNLLITLLSGILGASFFMQFPKLKELSNIPVELFYFLSSLEKIAILLLIFSLVNIVIIASPTNYTSPDVEWLQAQNYKDQYNLDKFILIIIKNYISAIKSNSGVNDTRLITIKKITYVMLAAICCIFFSSILLSFFNN